MVEKTFAELKREVETTQREMDRLRGSIDELSDQLKKEYDVRTLAEAKRLLSKLEKTRDRLQSKCGKQLEEFRHAWNGRMD